MTPHLPTGDVTVATKCSTTLFYQYRRDVLRRSVHDGVGIVTDDVGDGETVLLLHGWPDTAALWDEVGAGLVASGMRVLAPDLRGCGRSDKPEAVSAYAMGHLVADVLAMLDEAGVATAHVVGHDWGAALAWAVATFAPERVTSLAALAVGHPTAFRSAGIEQQLKSLYTQVFIRDGVGEAFVSQRDYELLRTWFAHPRAASVIAELERDGQLHTHLNWYRANLPADAFLVEPPRLPPVLAPTLGVWSSGDRALSESQMVESGRYCANGFTYVRLEGYGHWFPLEAPEEVTKVLRDFQARVA